MLVLGIDPGTAITGYGLVRETGDQLQAVAYGAITTPPDWALPQRLRKIYGDLTALIREYSPTESAVDNCSLAVTSNGISGGAFRGVVRRGRRQAAGS
jgi:crossover junction endodeoxyribonuclease RuvC